MRLYLIRHGESANNALMARTGRAVGRSSDPELTENGHKQAELLAGYLAHPQGDPLQHPRRAPESGPQAFGLTHIYCSLMTRSILTAQYVAKACGLPFRAHPDIFENQGIFNLAEDGSKTGLPGPDRSYFEQRFPDLQLPDGMGAGGWYDRPHETREVFLQRAQQVASEFSNRHSGSDDSVALVIHGNLIDQLLNVFTGVERKSENYDGHWEANWATHNTSITRIDFTARSQVVVYSNRLDHLPPELITW